MEKLIIKEPFGTYVIAQKPIAKSAISDIKDEKCKKPLVENNKNLLSITEIQNSIENEAYKIKLQNQIKAADDYLASFFRDRSDESKKVKQETVRIPNLQILTNQENSTIKRSIPVINQSIINTKQTLPQTNVNLIKNSSSNHSGKNNDINNNNGLLRVPLPPQKIRHLSSNSNLSDEIILSVESSSTKVPQIAHNGSTANKRSSDGTIITSSGRTILPVKDRPFRCPHPSKKDPNKPCPSAFMRADELKRHIKIHNPNKPYKCSFCDMRFSRTDHLTTHTRTHTKEKPYHCQYPGCDKKFARSDERLRHHAVHENRLKKQRSQMESQEKEKEEVLKKQQAFTTMPNLSFTSMLRPQSNKISSAPIQLKLSNLNGMSAINNNNESSNFLQSPVSNSNFQISNRSAIFGQNLLVSSKVKKEITEDD